MPQIGSFTRTQTGFAGSVHTLTLSADLVLVPAEQSDTENAPDYRLHWGDGDGPEIGAGWKRTGERAGDYISLILDDPALPQPIRANLFRDNADGSSWSLHWNRPAKASEKR
jgi:uncharacterized protein (DUF736 family)